MRIGSKQATEPQCLWSVTSFFARGEHVTLNISGHEIFVFV